MAEDDRLEAIIIDDSDSDDEFDLEVILNRIAVPAMIQPEDFMTDEDSDTESSSADQEEQEEGEVTGQLSYAEELTEHGDVEWKKLPSTVVVKILWYLDDSSRGRMARVCKNWLACFSDPCLWRTRYVEFRGIRGVRTGESCVGFARSFGPHLRHLYISCDNPSFLLCKRFQQTMDNFLNILCRTRYGSCQLRTLNILRMHVDRYWRSNKLRDKVIQTLLRFFRLQHRLRAVDMSEALFPVPFGLSLLGALASGSGRTLRVLNMEDYFRSRAVIFTLPRFRRSLAGFRSLATLHINYNYISDDVLLTMAANMAPRLRNLSVKVFRHDPHLHRITNDSWLALKRACPNLRVHLLVEGIGPFSEMIRLLSSAMPLTSLQLWTGVPMLIDHWQVDETLLYIGDQFGQVIEELSLALENPRESIDEALITMLTRCRRLEYLDLQAILMVPTIDTICVMQEQFKIGLQRCNITLENLTGIEVEELEAINDRHAEMIEQRGLDFTFAPNGIVF